MALPLWADIDLAAIAHNTTALKRIIGTGVRLLVAVKADAYGHGAEQVAHTALANGASDLGVARIEEGIALRSAGIAAPVLIFGYTHADAAPQLLDNGLIPSVHSLENAQSLAASSLALGRELPVHIKLDTGMGRMGIPCGGGEPEAIDRVAETVMRIARLEGLRLEGVYTHFATADHSDKAYAHRQFGIFTRLLDRLAASGQSVGLRHAANSGAIIDMPETHLDMVRAGISLYGLYPSGEVDRHRIALKPALSLKAGIIHLKQVPADTCISYGCTYRTSSPATIATIPVGYADGYSRALSNRGAMLVGGHRVPIVGRVCMDLTMVDVSAVPNVSVGDEVVLIGRQGGEEISADEVAETLGTINYEVVASLTGRVKRIFYFLTPASAG